MIRLSKSVIGAEEKSAVMAVLDRGYLGMGPQVLKFEEELCAYLGGTYQVVCVNTGTAALHLALQTIGIGPGDEVLVPSLTYVATFQAVSATGASPIACDVREDDALLDLQDAARKITSRTKAIVPVHYASEMGDLRAIYDFAAQNHLRVIEDAAQAFGCSYRGTRIGAQGDIVCFSFDGIKNITSGEGGAVVTQDPEILRKVKDARLLGVEGDSERRYKLQRSWDFDVREQGWRYHMSDIMASIGRAQLRRLDAEFAPKRVELSNFYRRELSTLRNVRLLDSQQGVVPHIFPIRVLEGRRDFLRKALLDNDVQVGIHYRPNHLLSRYRSPAQHLPVSEMLYSQLLSLPLHAGLTESDLLRVVDLIRATLA